MSKTIWKVEAKLPDYNESCEQCGNYDECDCGWIDKGAEISVYRSDNKFALDSWGWSCDRKIILLDDDGEEYSKKVINRVVKLAHQFAHQLNEENFKV